MRKPAIYLAAVALVVGTGTAGALAASHGGSHSSSTIHSQIMALESRALAVHQSQLASALHHMDVAVTRGAASNVHAQPSSPPPSCPPHSLFPGLSQPCGKDHHSPPPTPPCGPADQGGSAATGPVSSQVYAIGEQISTNGGAPLGDAVQSIACAVSNLTGGAL